MLTSEETRDHVISVAGEIKPLSSSVARLIGLMSHDDWDLDDVTRVVNLDQVLTARLLKVANCATKRGRGTVESVTEAILRIGPASILTYAIAGSTRDDLAAGKLLLWKRSVAAALTVEVARSVGVVVKKMPVVTQAAALLHDFGLLVLHEFARRHGMQAEFDHAHSGASRILVGERSIFGIDHAELGALIADRWRLPQALVGGIANHHQPDESPDLVADIVHLAAEVSAALVQGEGGMTPACISSGVVERLGLNEGNLGRLFDTVADQIDDAVLRLTQ